MPARSGRNKNLRPSSQGIRRRQSDGALPLHLSRFAHEKASPGFQPAARTTTAVAATGQWSPSYQLACWVGNLSENSAFSPFGLYVVASSEGIDGCPRFAQAYLGRKRWAKPNDRFRRHRMTWSQSTCRRGFEEPRPTPPGPFQRRLFSPPTRFFREHPPGR